MKCLYDAAFQPAPPTAGWHSVLTHTHMLQGELDESRNADNLAAWARHAGLDAIGVGSPFIPGTKAAYALYEGAQRDTYYSPDFDPQPLKHEGEVRELIDELNRVGRGDTLFYLDNETPKARYGHMWWFGWWHDFPEWHDYDQPFDRWMCGEQEAGDHDPEPMPYRRRPYSEIVAAQRMRGAMGIWAHPTSWWTSDKGGFVTNIASEMPAHLLADGMIDGLVVMGYDAYRPSYLELWRYLLDAGYEVLGVAETDVGLSSRKLWDIDPLLLTWIARKGALHGVGDVIESLSTGQAYASSGPSLQLSVDGHPMGSRVPTAPGRRHIVTVQVDPRDGSGSIGRLELLGRGGRVLWSVDRAPAGAYTLTVEGGPGSGYLQAQAFGKDSLPDGQPANRVRAFAVTNPVYLREPGNTPPPPLRTETLITVARDSGFRGGRVSLQTADGTEIEEGPLSGGDAFTADMPANGRIIMTAPDGSTGRRYLINDNPITMDCQRYLYRGRFLLDHPDTAHGNVPCQAFNLPGFRVAMSRVELTL